jgi:hypothetical protein
MVGDQADTCKAGIMLVMGMDSCDEQPFLFLLLSLLLFCQPERVFSLGLSAPAVITDLAFLRSPFPAPRRYRTTT